MIKELGEFSKQKEQIEVDVIDDTTCEFAPGVRSRALPLNPLSK